MSQVQDTETTTWLNLPVDGHSPLHYSTLATAAGLRTQGVTPDRIHAVAVSGLGDMLGITFEGSSDGYGRAHLEGMVYNPDPTEYPTS